MKFSGYQTILRADGTIEKGLFPTLEWYEKIKKYVSFKDKSVLDAGSCDGMFSILALKDGASEVTGIEHEKEKCNTAIELANEHKVPLILINDKIENVGPDKHLDIILLPMIIHWIGPSETVRLVTWAKRYIIIIYREANDGYKNPENGIWFPTQMELDATFPRCRKIHDELLMEQDDDKKIRLAIYEKVIS